MGGAYALSEFGTYRPDFHGGCGKLTAGLRHSRRCVDGIQSDVRVACQVCGDVVQVGEWRHILSFVA
jgi:hypothetical protein